jgi:signal transduction histidine kinase
MALARDVTEEKATEAALRAAKEQAESASRAKSTFLATMSHELRTPLNSVIGFSRILMRAVSADSKEANYLGRIRDNGLHLLRVINDILDLSKIEAGHMELVLEPVDLEALVADVVGSLRGASGGLEFRALTEQPVTARTDGARLRQVLFNLIGNALKFTPEGTVQVVVRHDDLGARIDVEDTGIGIPDHRLASIFEAFTQADPSTSRQFGGTGLGLSLSQAFCEHLGVELRASSEVGTGSVFSVVFPSELLVEGAG